jgi:hypothetical protein
MLLHAGEQIFAEANIKPTLGVPKDIHLVNRVGHKEKTLPFPAGL